MSYDYSKLRGRIIEKVGTLGAFAKLMGTSKRTISLKMTGKTGWKQADIEKACGILDIERGRIWEYFFYPKS